MVSFHRSRPTQDSSTPNPQKIQPSSTAATLHHQPVVHVVYFCRSAAQANASPAAVTRVFPPLPPCTDHHGRAIPVFTPREIKARIYTAQASMAMQLLMNVSLPDYTFESLQLQKHR